MMKSLSSRLVLTAVLLVAVVSLLIGTTTTLIMRDNLTARLDNRSVRASTASLTGPHRPGATCRRATDNFQGIGTLTAVVTDDRQWRECRHRHR